MSAIMSMAMNNISLARPTLALTISALGGGGGAGGADGNSGHDGYPGLIVVGNYNALKGFTTNIYVGNGGGGGSTSATGTGGGSAGADAAGVNYDGGRGGNAGGSGWSGGGGGLRKPIRSRSSTRSAS